MTACDCTDDRAHRTVARDLAAALEFAFEDVHATWDPDKGLLRLMMLFDLAPIGRWGRRRRHLTGYVQQAIGAAPLHLGMTQPAALVNVAIAEIKWMQETAARRWQTGYTVRPRGEGFR